MQNSIIDFYSKPQIGGSMPVFAGARRYQMGGGFFSTLARFAIPILKSIGGRVFNVATRTAADVFQNKRPIGQSIVDNTLDEVKSVLGKRSSSVNKEGGGDIFTSRYSHFKRRK